ncbi:DUF262 domain-containing protein [Halomonas sp. QHL1]|uniref:DUF262 domain-containing protein n=1 Tax=Halomonas sp. QHL1 TaxID=1123773 RepID=UPI0008FD10C4|nr:DUF262 domain-containing protein [Halomonas sp. QHL1]OJA06608.1 hypothetical protein QHL1GM_15075 [Halomonas sp. QHL1]
MTVQVATCSAAQLFSGYLLGDQVTGDARILSSDGTAIVGELTIPEYQRPYCWQDTQLSVLLQDITEHSRHHPALSYYLGSLILHQAHGQLNIIDGQQRITTLALMGCLLQSHSEIQASLLQGLEYEHPISQQQIKHNLKWLKEKFSSQPEYWQGLVDFNKLQFTLVVTQSEDDAYRFFETQNTGGVRLGGPDIIKAHHLRAVDKLHQKPFAKQWESLGKLDDTVSALLKGRYWQRIGMRELPSHQQKKQLRDCIVSEFAQQTGKGEDIAFGRTYRYTGLSGDVSHHQAQQGYDVRQPLNAGVNTIRYLSYFQGLYNGYWEKPDLPHLPGYHSLIVWLKGMEGCGYLEGLYKACLLLYISQFGENQLEQAAKKLFLVVYSRRVSNQKAVREKSIYAFTREYPVLDWIGLSYTPEQCFAYLDSFVLTVEGSNLDKNSVKKRYMDKVCEFFALELKPGQYKESFAQALTLKVAGDPL